MKRTLLGLGILAVPFVMASPVTADAICNDGWRSSSSGSGTCSWHGGVAYWLDDYPTYEYPTYEYPTWDYDYTPTPSHENYLKQIYGATTTTIKPATQPSATGSTDDQLYDLLQQSFPDTTAKEQPNNALPLVLVGGVALFVIYVNRVMKR